MKNFKLARLLWMLGLLVLALSCAGAALGPGPQERDSRDPAAQPQQPPEAMNQQRTSDMDQLPATKTFSGKIMKSGDRLVLQDSVGDSIYQLDDPKKAEPLEGKNVKVTGTVDPLTRTIHIVEIEPEQ